MNRYDILKIKAALGGAGLAVGLLKHAIISFTTQSKQTHCHDRFHRLKTTHFEGWSCSRTDLAGFGQAVCSLVPVRHKLYISPEDIQTDF